MRLSECLIFAVLVMTSCVTYSYKSSKDNELQTDLEKEQNNMLEIYKSPNHMLLTSTPYVIALLGQLMLIATENDFTLAENPPREGFKYLKYPSSFRASLLQMTNIGWTAFNEAHTNMDSIRIHTSNVRRHVQTLVKLLNSGKPEDIKAFLPLTLQKIERIADDCIKLSQSVEDKFIDFSNIAAELLEVSTAAKSIHDKELKETELAIKAAALEKQKIKQERKTIEKRFDEMKKDIDRAQGAFKDAVTEMPSTMKLFGLSLLDGVGNVLKSFIPGTAPPVFEDISMHQEDESDEDIARKYAYSFSAEIHNHIQKLVDIATSGKEKGHKEPNRNEIQSVHALKHSLKFIQGNLERDDIISDVHEQGIDICENAIRLSDELIEVGYSISTQKENILALIMNLEDLLIDADKFSSEAAAFSISRGPRTWWSSSKTSSGFAQREIKKAELNVEITKEILKEARKKQEDAIRSVNKNNDRMAATIKELASMKIKHVDFDEIRKTLIKGLEAVHEVRKEWGKVARYFQSISKLVKMNFYEYLHDFVQYASIGSNTMSTTDGISDAANDLISTQLSQVLTVTYIVREISSTYVDISEKYLIDSINSLGRLSALDPTTDSDEIEEKRQLLLDYSEHARKEITSTVNKKYQEFQSEVEKKYKELN